MSGLPGCPGALLSTAVFLACAVVASPATALEGPASEGPQRPTVFVPPFEAVGIMEVDVRRLGDRDRDELTARYAEVARSLLEDVVTNLGVARLVDRSEGMEALIVEELKRQRSRHYDRASLAEIGKRLGASHILVGEFLSLGSRGFDGAVDGRRMITTTVTAELRVKLVNVETAEQEYSQRLSGRHVYRRQISGTGALGDTAFEVLSKALEVLDADERLAAALDGSRP